jgi:ATP-dependent DNA helicase RecQ
MADDILSDLELTPADVPTLPAKDRNALVAYLLRWEHYDAARRCLQQLLVTHSHTVSVYDSLARVYLGLNEPGLALEMMRRRHALKISNSSRALEARAHVAAGDLSAAQAVARELLTEHPHMITAWSLQTDLCLAAGDLDGAEAALRQRESLRPDVAATAQGFARLWQARSDAVKALLWARTALARTERDERQPAIELLRLLETLYLATEQLAQAEATSARLRAQRQQSLKDLRQALAPTPTAPRLQPIIPPPTQPSIQPTESTPRPAPAATAGDVIAGAVDLTPGERAHLTEALHRHFPHDAFRPGQADAVAAILRDESVLAVMPTGAGKSLCYQLAALLLPGTTLVISPLIALMKDQIDGLPADVAGQATTLNSTLDSHELEARLGRAAAGGYKLLYAAPERLRQRPFLHALKRAGVSLLVVDEAHCVSLWGHDFRPDYLFIAKAWRELGQPPILAMTATATPRVRDDIQAALGQMRLIAIDVHRPNLRLEARRLGNDAEKRQALQALCREIGGSGIVYANARLKCEQLAAMLCRIGVSAIHYHAGIKDRAAAQDRFMSGQARVVVATIAFGMGVDKADVRFIVHYNPPNSLENYYQEAGRAGRDGLPARCILLHASSDKGNLTRWTRQGALHLEFLRQVYAALQRRLGAEGVGLVATGDLERDLVADATRLRVAIHFLETAGLLWRGFDLPRTATLTLCRSLNGDDADFARFVQSSRLRPGQTVSRDLLGLSRDAGLDPRTVEAQLLAWDDAGWLRYRGIGRDMLLALPDAPADSQQRVAAMLADHRAGQDGRIGEMMAYANTRRCRHGHVSAYFGGRPIERCEACDNCLGLALPIPRPERAAQPTPRPTIAYTPDKAEEGDPARTVLRAVTQLPFPLGRSGLARALQGARTSPVKADRFSMLGALAGSTQKSIRHLIARLEDQGLLEHYSERGYRLLRLTDEGRTRLEAQPPALEVTVPLPPQFQDDTPAEYDKALFEGLRAWRLETAREIGKPPYVICHNTVLQRIAASHPTTLEELAAIKGIGPRKLEQYGQAILDIIADQASTPAGEETE